MTRQEKKKRKDDQFSPENGRATGNKKTIKKQTKKSGNKKNNRKQN